MVQPGVSTTQESGIVGKTQSENSFDKDKYGSDTELPIDQKWWSKLGPCKGGKVKVVWGNVEGNWLTKPCLCKCSKAIWTKDWLNWFEEDGYNCDFNEGVKVWTPTWFLGGGQSEVLAVLDEGNEVEYNLFVVTCEWLYLIKSISQIRQSIYMKGIKKNNPN